MQKHVRRLVGIVEKTIPLPGPIYEFGALQVNNEPLEDDLRTLFERDDYVGCDFRAGPGVDRILDLHDIDLPDETAGTVISIDTLEHVEYPRRAMEEIYRILENDGIVVISSVMNFPIHSYPNDYWRFTPEGFRSLLQVFDESFVGSCGKDTDFPQTIVGIGFKGAVPDLSAFNEAYLRWETRTNAIFNALG
jgi:SAM-dependent methyltransferase